jgi:hypothetical protein
MSEATEMLEHMEHAGHGGGHGDGKGPGKQIGITMALLGVMLAFCAAMVGSERTELIKTMVEQSNKYGIYQSETTKLRVIEGNLEILHALTPSKEEAAKLDRTLRGKSRSSGKADDEDTAEIKDLIASSMDDMADLLSPDGSDILHFENLAKRFTVDVKEAKEDAEAYEGAVRTHERASELYERAQLAAEIGIVVASVALLMASRKVWAISVISGALGLATVGYTAYTTHEGLAAAEAKIEEASKREASMEKEDEADEKAAEAKENAAEAEADIKEAAEKKEAAGKEGEKKDAPKAGEKKEAPKGEAPKK